jgi:glycosyltransferase involved in cell wall biosynthesis
MRQLLLITFWYPPSKMVGAVRPAALVKYLPQFGWETLVLTPRIDGACRQSKMLIETGYKDVLQDWKARLRLSRKRTVHEQFGLPSATRPGSVPTPTRVLNFVRYLLSYPDRLKGWIPFALSAVEEIRRQNRRIDAIVTTFPPIPVQLIGPRAKSLLGCPWIADFRDLWTQNLAAPRHSRQFIQIGLEKRTLGQADALVTVSAPWADRLRERYPNKKVFTITNGFDPDDFCPPPPAVTREFSITYTGQFYSGQRDPTALFEVVRDLVKVGAIAASDLRIRFYGSVEPWLHTLVQEYGLNKVVELNGSLPRPEAIERQRESQILLILPWDDPGHHSAKLFEYFAAARPVLAVGGRWGVLTQALEETQAGVHALSEAQLRDFLLNAYAEYKKHGRVSYSGNRQAIERYSHPEMARSFSRVLDGIVQ